MVNINKHGLMILGHDLVHQNQIYQVKLRSVEEGIDFELGAESAWNQYYPDQNQYLTGFNIIDISPYHEAALIDLLMIPGIQDNNPDIDCTLINAADIRRIAEKASAQEAPVGGVPSVFTQAPDQTWSSEQAANLSPSLTILDAPTAAFPLPSSKTTPTNQPTHFGKYVVIDILGQGNMGIVYRCLDPAINRQVAIKTVSYEGFSQQAKELTLERFSREIKAVGRLSHPNIIAIYESGKIDETPYFAMEYIAGKDLSEHLKNRTFSVEESLKIMSQVLDALHYSHSMGIVHRDLKPGNLFMDEQGRVKLSDFGIAKVEDTDYTVPGTILGTPTYMSPEQCQGRPVDARTDIFSSAVVLYELLTSEQCFSANSSYSVMQNILNLEPIKPSSLNVQISPFIDPIIAKAMSKRPCDRYQSAMALKEALLSGNHNPSKILPLWRNVGVAVTALSLIAVLSAAIWYTQ